MDADARIPCRTPAAGRDGATRIPAWKFDLMRAAILDVLGQGDLAFADLKEAVRPRIPKDKLDALGSLGWHVTTVKLELEVRGEIARLPKSGPQQITLGTGSSA